MWPWHLIYSFSTQDRPNSIEQIKVVNTGRSFKVFNKTVSLSFETKSFSGVDWKSDFQNYALNMSFIMKGYMKILV